MIFKRKLKQNYKFICKVNKIKYINLKLKKGIWFFKYIWRLVIINSSKKLY